VTARADALRQADQDQLPVGLDRGCYKPGEIGDRPRQSLGFIPDEMDMDFIGGWNGPGIAFGPNRYDHGAARCAADMQRH
jgi:hypothetical protein